ncbi:hypothetical protein D3C72_2024920 [compost metagenome]
MGKYIAEGVNVTKIRQVRIYFFDAGVSHVGKGLDPIHRASRFQYVAVKLVALGCALSGYRIGQLNSVGNIGL